MVYLTVTCITSTRRGNLPAAPKVAAEVAVAAINRALSGALATIVLTAVSAPLQSAVLPEDRADLMYHRYSGGGVTVDGPAVLVRKKLKDKYSLNAKYYEDSVSSASIDVQTTASRYSEKRTEYGIGLDTLQDKTTYSFNYTTSSENDYDAESAHLDISHDFFGDLTTASLGFSQGWDTVGKNFDDNWVDRDIDRRNYRASVNQVISRNAIINVAFESIIDEGSDNRALGNPYRSVRIYDADAGLLAFTNEQYPMTRNSDAWSVKLRYALEDKSVAFSEFRQFTDSWGIDAWNLQAGYIYPLAPEWLLEGRVRHYEQTAASFYNDLFTPDDNLNFYARDKELSTFSNNSFGVSASYERKAPEHWPISKARASVMLDYFMFEYDDFRDARKQATPGTEPMYEFNASVIRLLLSAWY